MTTPTKAPLKSSLLHNKVATNNVLSRPLFGSTSSSHTNCPKLIYIGLHPYLSQRTTPFWEYNRLPLSQDSPLHPGAHWQSPVTASHDPPLAHKQRRIHPGPNMPRAQVSLQCAPAKPARHAHAPVTGSQVPPFSQWHSCQIIKKKTLSIRLKNDEQVTYKWL